MSNNWLSTKMRSDKIHSVIKNFENMFPDQFEKTDIKKCDKCQGGLVHIEIGYELKENICSNCRGLAYYGFDLIYTNIVCDYCCGSGCRFCDNGLVVNWLDKIMRPDRQALKKKREYPF
jgi:hypothetical protein